MFGWHLQEPTLQRALAHCAEQLGCGGVTLSADTSMEGGNGYQLRSGSRANPSPKPQPPPPPPPPAQKPVTDRGRQRRRVAEELSAERHQPTAVQADVGGGGTADEKILPLYGDERSPGSDVAAVAATAAAGAAGVGGNEDERKEPSEEAQAQLAKAVAAAQQDMQEQEEEEDEQEAVASGGLPPVQEEVSWVKLHCESGGGAVDACGKKVLNAQGQRLCACVG